MSASSHALAHSISGGDNNQLDQASQLAYCKKCASSN